MYVPEDKLAIVMLRTNTLVAWLRRPRRGHANWWIAYYSTDADEVLAWDMAMQKAKLYAFHQGCWAVDHKVRHPECEKRDYEAYTCPGVAQGWEMLGLGCSDWALEEHESPLEEVREYGDSALESVLTCFKVIALNANTLLHNWQVRLQDAPELFRHSAIAPVSANV